MAKITELWRNMSCEELNRQYSPSKWSKRMPAADVIVAHIHAIETGWKKILTDVPLRESVSYGPTERQELDVFYSKKLELEDNGLPVFAFIHGGYWQELDKTQGCFCVKPLVMTAKCVVVLIGYDLAPSVQLSTIVDQIQRAAKWVISFAKERKSSGVYFCGHSAGGHLAAMIATSDWLKTDEEARKLIKAYIPISGIFDLKPVLETEYNDALKMTEQDAVNFSPVFLLRTLAANVEKTSEFLIVIAENDSPEFIRQSMEMHQCLQKADIRSRYLLVPNVDHFNIMENLADESFGLLQEIICMISQIIEYP